MTYTGYSRYEDALIAKVKVHEWYSSTDGEKYLHAFFDSMNSKHDPSQRLSTDGLVYLQRQMIQRADPIYVSMDITDLVDHARWSFDPEPLLPGDPFVPSGFAIFPRPIYMEDAPWDEEHPGRYKEGIPVRAVAWMPMHTEDLSAGCYWISFFNHVDDDPDFEGGFQRWSPNERQYFRRFAPLLIGHNFQWSWGDTPQKSSALVYENETEEQGHLRARHQSALMQTFWRIGQQRVPVPERVPRGLWRDSKRKGIEHRDVKVMTLRRAREKEYEPTGRAMKVRSITSGHWRNQWYSSIQEHRQIWIFPYMRGPEDAPLITPQRAVEFRR
jgi:hypothetical protein